MKCLPALLTVAMVSGCAAVTPETGREVASPPLPVPTEVAEGARREVVVEKPDPAAPAELGVTDRQEADMTSVLARKGIPTRVENREGLTVWVYEVDGGVEYFYFRKGSVSGHEVVPGK